MQKFETMQDLFADPERWTRGVYFRDAEGNPCTRDIATCACLAGGVKLVYGEWSIERLRANGRINSYIRGRLPVDTLAAWNDHPLTTIQDVQKLCKDLNL